MYSNLCIKKIHYSCYYFCTTDDGIADCRNGVFVASGSLQLMELLLEKCSYGTFIFMYFSRVCVHLMLLSVTNNCVNFCFECHAIVVYFSHSLCTVVSSTLFIQHKTCYRHRAFPLHLFKQLCENI